MYIVPKSKSEPNRLYNLMIMIIWAKYEVSILKTIKTERARSQIGIRTRTYTHVFMVGVYDKVDINDNTNVSVYIMYLTVP